MAITQLKSNQLGSNSVTRDDIDTTTTTKAVIAKVIAGDNVSLASSGVDAGTGDVTVNGISDYSLKLYNLAGSVIRANPLAGNIANLSTALALADQSFRTFLLYVPVSFTATGFKWWQGVQGSYTSNNYNGIGLFSLSAGTMTLIASSTDDGTIWKAAQGWASKAFSSTIALTGQTLYVGALLYCRSAETTAPQIGAFANSGSSGSGIADFANSVKNNATLAAQTVFPSSKAFSLMTISGNQPGLFLY